VRELNGSLFAQPKAYTSPQANNLPPFTYCWLNAGRSNQPLLLVGVASHSSFLNSLTCLRSLHRNLRHKSRCRSARSALTSFSPFSSSSSSRFPDTSVPTRAGDLHEDLLFFYSAAVKQRFQTVSNPLRIFPPSDASLGFDLSLGSQTLYFPTSDTPTHNRMVSNQKLELKCSRCRLRLPVGRFSKAARKRDEPVRSFTHSNEGSPGELS
jgi:hypothetical protein